MPYPHPIEQLSDDVLVSSFYYEFALDVMLCQSGRWAIFRHYKFIEFVSEAELIPRLRELHAEHKERWVEEDRRRAEEQAQWQATKPQKAAVISFEELFSK